MGTVWCEWESQEFDSSNFETYRDGPLLLHKGVKVPHTNNGIALGGIGPSGAGAASNSEQNVAYGDGPMAEPRAE